MALAGFYSSRRVEVIMLGAFGFALYRGVTLPWLRIVMLFGVLHLALSQVRHADLLGLLAPIFLARPLAEQFKVIAAADNPVSTRHGTLLPIAALALLVAITGLASLRSIVPSVRITPAHAIQSVELAKVGPVLNDYDFGGYLTLSASLHSSMVAPNSMAKLTCSVTTAR